MNLKLFAAGVNWTLPQGQRCWKAPFFTLSLNFPSVVDMGIYKLNKYNGSPRRRYFIERVMKDIEKYSMSHDVFAKPFPLRNNGFKQSISENMLSLYL